MIPRPEPASAELRRLLRDVAAQYPAFAERAASGELALNAMLAERAAPPMPGAPSLVLRVLRATAQLAAAVEYGHLAEGNRAQARFLNLRVRTAIDAVSKWTKDGKREPT